jgi:hypothetical protein
MEMNEVRIVYDLKTKKINHVTQGTGTRIGGFIEKRIILSWCMPVRPFYLTLTVY